MGERFIFSSSASELANLQRKLAEVERELNNQKLLNQRLVEKDRAVEEQTKAGIENTRRTSERNTELEEKLRKSDLTIRNLQLQVRLRV